MIEILLPKFSLEFAFEDVWCTDEFLLLSDMFNSNGHEDADAWSSKPYTSKSAAQRHPFPRLGCNRGNRCCCPRQSAISLAGFDSWSRWKSIRGRKIFPLHCDSLLVSYASATGSIPNEDCPSECITSRGCRNRYYSAQLVTGVDDFEAVAFGTKSADGSIYSGGIASMFCLGFASDFCFHLFRFVWNRSLVVCTKMTDRNSKPSLGDGLGSMPCMKYCHLWKGYFKDSVYTGKRYLLTLIPDEIRRKVSQFCITKLSTYVLGLISFVDKRAG